MKRNYLLLVLFLLLYSYSFSQTRIRKDKPVENAATIQPETKKPVSQLATSSAAVGNEVFEKMPLPPNQKVSPANFYVENDKPIDLQQYQQERRQRSRK